MTASRQNQPGASPDAAVEALFLDLNSTLVDGGGVREAVRRTCHEVAAALPGLDAARLLQANTTIWRSYWPEVEDQWTLGALDGETVSLEAWRRALRACGYDDESLARRARAAHRRHDSAALRLFDDARELLDWLSAVGLPIALITNGAGDSQRAALRRLDIEDRFRTVVISGELGIAKPDRAIFDAALASLGVAREHVWHVGDSLAADIAGARSAGLTAVWLNRDGLARHEGDPTPDHEIRRLSELPALLAASN